MPPRPAHARGPFPQALSPSDATLPFLWLFLHWIEIRCYFKLQKLSFILINGKSTKSSSDPERWSLPHTTISHPRCRRDDIPLLQTREHWQTCLYDLQSMAPIGNSLGGRIDAICNRIYQTDKIGGVVWGNSSRRYLDTSPIAVTLDVANNSRLVSRRTARYWYRSRPCRKYKI